MWLLHLVGKQLNSFTPSELFYPCKLEEYINEPHHEKTCLRCLRPGKTQSSLRSHRS